MAIAEKNIVITSKDELNQTVIYKPYTSVDLVEGAVSSINGITPDEHGNIKVNTSITVDDKLDKDSINPVQNKVVTKEIERIPYKLTVECIGFDGGKVNTDYTATGMIGLSLSTDKDYSKTDVDYGGAFASLMSHELYSLDNKVQKTVYIGTPYAINIQVYDSAVQFGDYYDPDRAEISGVITGDTDIVITFRKKREPITLTINLKDKNGNFVSDDVIITDSFDNKTTTVGTYGKTPGQFTVQVTKGYEYTIAPSLKGYNNEENNSPADPDKTTITQTSTEDTVIDIVYNKTYPNDYETNWASFHTQIAANPGVEVLPIGTELITIYEDTTNNKTVVLKWNIVNWRYGEKEDGSQVWGCDLFQKRPIPDNTYTYDSGSKIWGKSEIRNTLSGLSKQYQNNDFKNNLQAVKVTTSIIYEGPAEYSYDKMWIPSATELYIDTTERENSCHFTTISEGNDNEAYWKNIIGIQNKIVIGSSDYQKYLKWEYDENNKYMDKCWLRSTSYFKQHISGEMKPDGSIQDDIIRYDVNGQFVIYRSGDLTYDSQKESNVIRPMCFFA